MLRAVVLVIAVQVPRILNPVVMVLEELPKLYRDPNLRQYIDNTFGERSRGNAARDGRGGTHERNLALIYQGGEGLDFQCGVAVGTLGIAAAAARPQVFCSWHCRLQRHGCGGLLNFRPCPLRPAFLPQAAWSSAARPSWWTSAATRSTEAAQTVSATATAVQRAAACAILQTSPGGHARRPWLDGCLHTTSRSAPTLPFSHPGPDFFDAGSCIDGRLTSAWNWCSKLEKKVGSCRQLTGPCAMEHEYPRRLVSN